MPHTLVLPALCSSSRIKTPHPASWRYVRSHLFKSHWSSNGVYKPSTKIHLGGGSINRPVFGQACVCCVLKNRENDCCTVCPVDCLAMLYSKLLTICRSLLSLVRILRLRSPFAMLSRQLETGKAFGSTVQWALTMRYVVQACTVIVC